MQDAITAASNDDTVLIPDGTCAWTVGVTTAKAITLSGQHSCTLDSNGRPTSCPTVIKDQIPDANGDGLTDSAVLKFTALVSNKASRITQLEFQDGTVNAVNFNGVVSISAGTYNLDAPDTRKFRMDHVRMVTLQGTNLFTQDTIGVIDHNYFVLGGNDLGASRIGVYVYHEHWQGGSNSDKSFSDTPRLGTASFLFIEDNTFTRTGTVPYAITDAYRGARYVVRYNNIQNSWVEAHGSDSGGRLRGTRVIEIYNNSFTCTVSNCNYVANVRSGTGVIHDNTTSGFTTPHLTLAAYRMFWPFSPWGIATGRSDYDVNTSAALYTGTATCGGGTCSAQHMVASGASFPDLTGYTVRKTSTCSTTQCAAIITSNTATDLTFHNSGGYSGSVLSFTNGETYEINLVGEVLDQPGRGQGTEMTGAVPSWTNDQVDEPLYEWNNTQGATNINFTSDMPLQIRSGEHFFNDTEKPGYTPYTYPHPDATTASSPPTITITGPTSSSTYETTATSVTLAGTASDSGGSVSSVVWANSTTGGAGTATGTTSWSASVSVNVGSNQLTATATDNSGNTTSAALRVLRANVPATPADAFTVTDGWATLGPNWTTQITGGALGVNASQQAYVSSGTLAFARASAWTPANDQYAQIALNALPTDTDFAYVGVRASGADATWNGFYCAANATQMVPIVLTNGVASYLTPASVTWSVIDTIRAECSSTTCVCKQSGTQRTSNTLSAPTSGTSSLGLARAMVVDDFVGGDLGGDTTGPAVVITGPTSRTTYVTGTSPITISGTASDGVGVASCSGSSDFATVGNITGTTSWSGSVTLAPGANVVTIDCQDAAGNHGTDQITIRFLVPDAGTDPNTARYRGKGKRAIH